VDNFFVEFRVIVYNKMNYSHYKNNFNNMEKSKTSFIVVIVAALVVGLGGGYYYGLSKGEKSPGRTGRGS
jgi:hypothetical protein